MFSMPSEVLQELTQVAEDTGLTVDQIIQEAVVNWIRTEAPAHMRNARAMKEFTDWRPFKVLEGGRKALGRLRA
jgi:hypothetical protein